MSYVGFMFAIFVFFLSCKLKAVNCYSSDNYFLYDCKMIVDATTIFISREGFEFSLSLPSSNPFFLFATLLPLPSPAITIKP